MAVSHLTPALVTCHPSYASLNAPTTMTRDSRAVPASCTTHALFSHPTVVYGIDGAAMPARLPRVSLLAPSPAAAQAATPPDLTPSLWYAS
jgi:hypothetical protein